MDIVGALPTVYNGSYNLPNHNSKTVLSIVKIGPFGVHLNTSL